MIITENPDLDIIKSIITNEQLFKFTYGQDCDVDKFEVDTVFKYLLISNNEEIVGCFQIKEMTHVTLEAHIFCLPKFWGTSISKEMANLGHQWALKHDYKTVYTTVPSICFHVLKYLSAIGYMACGCIKKGIIYNGHLVSLFLFEFDLEKS